MNKPRPAGPASIAGILPMNPNIMTCAAPLRDARETMARSLAAANLTVDTIDPVGLESAGNSPMGGSLESVRVRRDELGSLADMGSGRMITQTNAPEEQIPALFDDTQSYYELRLAVDASVNQRGSVYSRVGVPDFAQQPLSLSGIVLGAADEPSSAPKDALSSLLPLVPAARRQFATRDRVTAFVRVYEAAKKPPIPATITTRIADANDVVVSADTITTAADRFAGARAVEHRVDLPVSTLPAGEYLLTVEAKAGEYTAAAPFASASANCPRSHAGR